MLPGTWTTRSLTSPLTSAQTARPSTICPTRTLAGNISMRVWSASQAIRIWRRPTTRSSYWMWTVGLQIFTCVHIYVHRLFVIALQWNPSQCTSSPRIDSSPPTAPMTSSAKALAPSRRPLSAGGSPTSSWKNWQRMWVFKSRTTFSINVNLFLNDELFYAVSSLKCKLSCLFILEPTCFSLKHIPCVLAASIDTTWNWFKVINKKSRVWRLYHSSCFSLKC